MTIYNDRLAENATGISPYLQLCPGLCPLFYTSLLKGKNGISPIHPVYNLELKFKVELLRPDRCDEGMITHFTSLGIQCQMDE